MKLSSSAVLQLSHMICGDEAYKNIFPYRTLGAITQFFYSIDYRATPKPMIARKQYALDNLDKTNLDTVDEFGNSDVYPSPYIVKAIKELLNPVYFNESFDYQKAIDMMNNVLRDQGLSVFIDKSNKVCVDHIRGKSRKIKSKSSDKSNSIEYSSDDSDPVQYNAIRLDSKDPNKRTVKITFDTSKAKLSSGKTISELIEENERMKNQFEDLEKEKALAKAKQIEFEKFIQIAKEMAITDDKFLKQVIKMPEDFRTPLKQYLMFFNDFVKKTKGRDTCLEIHNHEAGLELLLRIDEVINLDDINSYLSEYVGFTRQNIDNLHVQFDIDTTDRQADLLILNLKHQLRSLQTNLEFSSAENKFLKGEYEKILKLFEIQLSHPLPMVIQQTQNNILNFSFEIATQLPNIQSNFNELKAIITSTDKQFKENLDEIGDSLDEVSPSSDKEKLNKPFNKLKRFLIELGNPNSVYNKIIQGSEKGVQLASKLLDGYNIIAPYLNMQTIEPIIRHLKPF